MENFGWVFIGCGKIAEKAAKSLIKAGAGRIAAVWNRTRARAEKFAEKYGLPFILLSDPELTAIQACDVWQEKKLYGKVSMGVVRSTFIIDENGVIEKVMPKVKPDTNAAEVLAYLKEGK